MLRTALRPRWLALLAVVVVAATGMSLLGQWQLDRARDRGRDARAEAVAQAPPSPVLEVLRPRTAFTGGVADRRVLAAGTWDGARQVLVAGRRQGGRTGFWVLTPLRLADGSGVGVVRGWVASAGDPAAAPPADEPVTVAGVLRPGEPPADRAPGQTSGLPPGQLDRVDLTQLIARWPYPLLTGYVVRTGQQPAATGAQPLPVPHETPPAGLAWRNLSYAVQWWLFAGFGLFLWWRVVRDDHLRAAEEAAGPPGGGPGAGERGEVEHDDPVTATSTPGSPS